MKARRFRPRLLPSLATAILLALFVGLGFWQLDRAQQKLRVQAEFDARARDGAIQIGAAPVRAEDVQYYNVTVTGRFDPAYQFLLDNKVYQGQAGYHVITPLRIDGGATHILVNRGWVPWGNDRRQLPDVAVPAGVQRVSGVAVVPGRDYFTLRREPVTGNWQAVWQNLDLARFIAAVPFRVQPVVIQLDPVAPGGFVRSWPRPDAGATRNQAYAFQWFALAAGLLLTVLVVNLRRTHGRGDDRSDTEDSG